jgi:hypothetical protein
MPFVFDAVNDFPFLLLLSPTLLPMEEAKEQMEATAAPTTAFLAAQGSRHKMNFGQGQMAPGPAGTANGPKAMGQRAQGNDKTWNKTSPQC